MNTAADVGSSLSVDVEKKVAQSTTRCDAYFGWLQALTLTERIEVLRAGVSHSTEIDGELADRRLRRWRNIFPTQASFESRLAMDDIKAEELLRLLGESCKELGERYPSQPNWLRRIIQAYSCEHSTDLLSHFMEKSRTTTEINFLYAIWPLISEGVKRFRVGIQSLMADYESCPFSADTLETILFPSWFWELAHLIDRTLVLGLNVARVEGDLNGDTSEQRFANFIERLSRRQVSLVLLGEYPVLARQLLVQIDIRITFWLEFLRRLCNDWHAIQDFMGPDRQPGTLVRIEQNVGDRHCCGRSVLIATFRSGWKVVYKPKSLAVDVHFQGLLSWLNERGFQPYFRTYKVLDRGTYGWAEYIENKPCRTSAALNRFYRRQGGYLALLYVLCATDFHFENLVAAGEHPVLLDLETLFHTAGEKTGGDEVDQLVIGQLLSSVLKVGLLPMRLWLGQDPDGLDISGLGATQGQLSPDPLPYWEGIGTDEMRLRFRKLRLKEGCHLPSLRGHDVRPLEYAEPLVRGFYSMYHLLLELRDELVSDSGPLHCFCGDEIRVILRPTRFYSKLLFESFHPDVLRNALDRDRLFDLLYISMRDDSSLGRVIAMEREDLSQGDIPAFFSRPGSRDLWSSSGKQLRNFFGVPPMDSVKQRFLQLGEDDLERQTWYIRASLATMATPDEYARLPVYARTNAPVVHGQTGLLDASKAIGNRLEALALCTEGQATWVGLTLIDRRNWVLAASGLDLYSGLPGIALFLAYLGTVTRDRRYSVLAQTATTTLRYQVRQAEPYVTSIGAFTGWAGIIYTFTHLGVLWNRPGLIAEAERIVKMLSELIDSDDQFDVIGGAAGCIACLLALYKHTSSTHVIDAALRCGEHLLDCSQHTKQGLTWAAHGGGTRPLGGFSHGAAGIAWALLKLASVSGDERFRFAANGAIEFERTLFCSKVGNWFDRREEENLEISERENRESFMTAWCNGAPGIGLGRLHSLDQLDDAEIREEIRVALTTTIQRGFGGNHCLCHGDLGNLEILLEAKHRLNDDLWRSEVDQRISQILGSIERRGLLCGVPNGIETPGLMTGIAGIGYGLLRLTDPVLVPSVLVLEPPTLNYSNHL